MFKEPLLKLINATIRQALASDESMQQYLKPLANKVIAIHIIGIEKTYFCIFTNETVQIHDHHDGAVNAKLTGGAFSLLAILLKKDLSVSGVSIEGEIDTAQQAKNFAEKLDIDWEDLLASKIGDSPAYHIHKIGRHLKNYFVKQHREFQENLSDYLKDEKKLLVSTEQVEHLFHEIDECRFHVDRLKVRIQHLQHEIRS